ncbi:MAG: hypothetical protein ACRDSF_01980 [Pseudonocardiaceae bacterium]
MTTTVFGAAVLVGLLVAVGGFIVGWIARTEQNHIYADSRRRHLAHLTELAELGPGRGRWDAERDVLYVPIPIAMPVQVPMPVPVPGWAQPVVTGTQTVPGQPELPALPLPGEDR